jgi:hypothetical protein
MSIATNGIQGTENAGITLTSSGQLIPGVAGKRIRVFAAFISTLLATSVKMQSNSTDITGTFACSDKGGFVIPAVNLCWCKTAVGEALNLNMTVATTVGIQVIYDVVD